jgi:hypothetical protein
VNGASLVHAQSAPVDAQATADAQATPPKKAKTVTYQGTIASLGTDKASFTITDKNGAPTIITTTPATTYQLDKNNATFQETVRVGLTAKGDLAADGTATLVSTKSLKISALDQMKQVLAAGDDEWLILRPLIEKIQNLQNQLSSATVSIKNLPPITASTNDEIKTQLATLRQASTKLNEDLAKARESLTKLLTVRQELILLQLGILE